jgi:dTDP-4-dehydrorhamnose 3,5-epimerase
MLQTFADQLRVPLGTVLIIEPKVFGDARGFFFESYNHRRFVEALRKYGKDWQ